MDRPFGTRLGRRREQSRDSGADPDRVRPFGPYGAGLITAHPAGLLVVAAIAFIALWQLPEARWFILGSVPLGILVGLALWLRHR